MAAGDLLARVRVRDGGICIESAVLPREGRAGNWGLQGMRECARHISGQWRCGARAAWARKHAWSTLLIRKTAVPSQMTGQLPIFAADSPGTAPLAQARGLDLIDDVGAVNTIGRQINALCGEMPKHGTAAFVDGRNVAQVKPDWFSF